MTDRLIRVTTALAVAAVVAVAAVIAYRHAYELASTHRDSGVTACHGSGRSPLLTGGGHFRPLWFSTPARHALVAIARTILVIIWHLLTDRAACYHDLGASYYTSRLDAGRRARNHIRQLQALGFTVTLTPAA